MKCPDCDGQLIDISLSGLDKSFRCFTCGGIWLIAKTVNGLPSEDLSSQWKKVEVDSERLKFGDNKCPVDGAVLAYYEGNMIPADLKVRQCPECHWWWFPADSLFKFKPFQEERIREQAKIKHMFPMMMAALIPLMSLVLLITGGVVGVKLLSGQQRVAVGAEGRLKEVYGMRLDSGELVVYFSYAGKASNSTFIFLEREFKWVPAKVSEVSPGRYETKLGNLIPEASGLKIKVGDEEATVMFRGVNP